MTRSLLARFCAKGVVIEGSGAMLAAATVAVMAVGMAAPDAAAALPLRRGAPAQHAGKAVKVEPKVDFKAMRADIQAQVDKEFPGTVYIVDRTADPFAETARIARMVGSPAENVEILDFITGEARASTYEGSKKSLCLVVGAEPSADIQDLAAKAHGLVYRQGSISDENVHRQVMWHEVGHCLLGSDEGKADAFGHLKMLTETKSTAHLEFSAVDRELDEWLGQPKDTHFISPTLRDVLAAYGSGEFASAPHTLKELSGIADAMPTHDSKRIFAIRDALAKTRIASDQAYLVPVKEGYVATTMMKWFDASSSVPELKRVGQLVSYLTGDPATRKMPQAFVPSPKDSAEAVLALAQAWDPIARRIAPAFGVKGLTPETPVAFGDGLPSGSQIEGRLLAFDRASAVVKFSGDLNSFLVRDADTKKPLLTGDAFRASTKTLGRRASVAEPSQPRI